MMHRTADLLLLRLLIVQQLASLLLTLGVDTLTRLRGLCILVYVLTVPSVVSFTTGAGVEDSEELTSRWRRGV